MPRVVVIGAGISGLAVAYRLQKLSPQMEVVVLEERDRPGGAMWTVRRDGFQVETGPDGFLDVKPSSLALCRDLGLQEQLVPANEVAAKNRFLFLGDKLRALPAGPVSFLSTDLLSWRGKLRLMLEPFRSRGPLDSGEESIDAFGRRRLGPEAAEVLLDALVSGIYAGDSKLLSMPACFPRLVALEKEFGSVVRGLIKSGRRRRLEAKARGEAYQRPGQLWSLRDGLRLLVETLCERLPNRPLLGIKVQKISRTGAPQRPQWLVQGEGQDSWQADAVVLTNPANQQATMLSDLDSELAERIDQIAYNKVAVLGLGYRRQDIPISVNGFGFIAPQRLRLDILGVQWCSSYYPNRAPEGAVLLRVMCGGWHRGDIVGWNDDRLLQAVRADLQKAMGITAPPIFQEIVRWDRAIPQYHLGHLERLAWLGERCRTHPGLFLGGNAYRGVSINDCTEQGELLAADIGKYLKNPGEPAGQPTR